VCADERRATGGSRLRCGAVWLGASNVHVLAMRCDRRVLSDGMTRWECLVYSWTVSAVVAGEIEVEMMLDR